MSSQERGHLCIGYIRAEAREQTTIFPVTLEELIPGDHVCRAVLPTIRVIC
jgi:hypothetical protein